MSQTNRKWQCASMFPFWKRKSLKKHFNRLWAFLQSTRGHERKLEWRINSKRVDHGGTKQFSKQQPTRHINVRWTGDMSDKQNEFKRTTRTRERKWARNIKILMQRKPAMFFFLTHLFLLFLRGGILLSSDNNDKHWRSSKWHYQSGLIQQHG